MNHPLPPRDPLLERLHARAARVQMSASSGVTGQLADVPPRAVLVIQLGELR